MTASSSNSNAKKWAGSPRHMMHLSDGLNNESENVSGLSRENETDSVESDGETNLALFQVIHSFGQMVVILMRKKYHFSLYELGWKFSLNIKFSKHFSLFLLPAKKVC